MLEVNCPCGADIGALWPIRHPTQPLWVGWCPACHRICMDDDLDRRTWYRPDDELPSTDWVASDDDRPRPVPLRQSERYQVLERDGHRCQSCGVSARDGAQLEVDHIIPRARGGDHSPGNLRTLCRSCNRGKGAR